MGSNMYGGEGEKLPSICPGITIRRIWGELANKQTGGRFCCILSKLVFYFACCRVLLDKISKNVNVSWNDSVGSVSARTVLIKWLILRLQSQAHWGEETIFDWGPGGLESAWSVGSRLIFRYRDMERERRHEDIVIYSYSFRYCERLD